MLNKRLWNKRMQTQCLRIYVKFATNLDSFQVITAVHNLMSMAMFNLEYFVKTQNNLGSSMFQRKRNSEQKQ